MSDERTRLTGVPLRASVKRKIERGPTANSFRAKARLHALAALDSMASLSTSAASEAVRVSAANVLFDRAYGKPVSASKTAVEKPDEEPITDIRWVAP